MKNSHKILIKKLFDSSPLNNSDGDPTITKKEARNIALQMKKIQEEELKNPKPIYDKYGILIMDDDPF